MDRGKPSWFEGNPAIQKEYQMTVWEKETSSGRGGPVRERWGTARMGENTGGGGNGRDQAVPYV
jgi:hypothetical protein